MRKALILVPVVIASLPFLFYISQGFSYDVTGPSPTLAGWRSSEYGYQQQQPPSYWINVADSMSSKFDGYSPAGIWVIGTEYGSDCYLQFPWYDGSFKHITFSKIDMNENYLNAFDQAGVNIWLQVEPSDANVETLIDLVLSRYSHHSSVIGFGVDVEWLNYINYTDGRAVTSAEASAWLERVKSYNPNYKLFLKHWEIDKMPETYPEDTVFISDSQEFDTYEDMLEDFENWGKHFHDADVGFQYGYESDRKIWESFDDPASKIGNDIIERIPNCRELYWVDFTIEDVFKP